MIADFWTRYRKWKHLLVAPLVGLGLLLMRGEPDKSPRWLIGIGISAVLVLAYVIEEIVWITQKRGRPCPNCGERVVLKPFTVQLFCPHCKKML